MANITADARLPVLTLRYAAAGCLPAWSWKWAPAGGRSCGAEAGPGGQKAPRGGHASDGGVGLGVVRPVVVPQER